MRSRLALVALAALLPLTLPAGAVAVSDAPTQQTAISKAKAKKLAKAAVLTASDLKGYDAEPATPDATDTTDDKALFKCIGAKVPKLSQSTSLGAKVVKRVRAV